MLVLQALCAGDSSASGLGSHGSLGDHNTHAFVLRFGKI